MKKSKFVKSTIILIIGGFITKMIGMLIKIITTRNLGSEGIGLYMLIMPTFSMFIALSQLGLPVAISKLVAEEKRNNKRILSSSIPLSLLVNILIFIFISILAPYLSNNLLHDNRTKLAIISIAFVLPFISLSSIARGYFFGKQKILPHVISNITEDIVRLLILIIGIPISLKKGIEYALSFIILSNIASELTSILILYFFLPKNFVIRKEDIKIDKLNIKDLLSIGIPTTIGRFIGNIGYFFEPILITTIMLKLGFNNTYIVSEYGIISGYVMPLLTLPSFFTSAISQALIPVVSKNYANNNLKETKRKIKQALFFSLLIGIPATIIFITIPEIPLKIIYNTNEGINYIRFLAPICLLLYIQSNLASSLQAMGKAKDSLKGTTIGMITRLLGLFIFLNLKLKLWSLVFAQSLSIILVTCFDAYKVKKYLK